MCKTVLGMVSYYRNFIKGFSEKGKPLGDLTKHDTVFRWNGLGTGEKKPDSGVGGNANVKPALMG
jgi:hypothetical protein